MPVVKIAKTYSISAPFTVREVGPAKVSRIPVVGERVYFRGNVFTVLEVDQLAVEVDEDLTDPVAFVVVNGGA